MVFLCVRPGRQEEKELKKLLKKLPRRKIAVTPRTSASSSSREEDAKFKARSRWKQGQPARKGSGC